MTGPDQADRQALRALSHWDADPASLALISARENVVYAIRLADGRRAVLRLHRTGYHRPAGLASELAWTAHLAACGLNVPSPVPARDGSLFITLPADDGAEGQLVDVLGFVAGEPMGRSGTPLPGPLDRILSVHRSLGRTLGRLHILSDGWSVPDTFERPRWDAGGLVGEAPFWGRFWDWSGLEAADRKRFSAFRDAAARQLADAGDSLDTGLIHADPVRENVLLAGNDICLIDFDDAGHGYRLFDLATALVKSRTEPHFDEISAALVAGYREAAPGRLPDLGHLDLFLAIRAATYVGWGAARLSEPGMAARMDRFVGETRAWLDRIGF